MSHSPIRTDPVFPVSQLKGLFSHPSTPSVLSPEGIARQLRLATHALGALSGVQVTCEEVACEYLASEECLLSLP